MRRLLIAVLFCGAVLSSGAAEARQPGKMLHLGTIVVPRHRKTHLVSSLGAVARFASGLKSVVSSAAWLAAL